MTRNASGAGWSGYRNERSHPSHSPPFAKDGSAPFLKQPINAFLAQCAAAEAAVFWLATSAAADRVFAPIAASAVGVSARLAAF